MELDRALQALAEEGLPPGVALVATGGYGRGELSPRSDIDLLFLTGPRMRPGPDLLRPLLYPLWDAGWIVGHAVRSPAGAIEFAAGDLPAATAILTARLLAGDPTLFDEFESRRQRWMRRRERSLVRRITETTEERHGRVERAGWALAPDLKEGAGGLRDAHAVGWLATITGESASLGDSYGVLMSTREGLHAHATLKLDRLRIDLQPAVAESLGIKGEGAADELMIAVHTAARTLEHDSRNAARARVAAVLGGPRRTGSSRRLDRGVLLTDGELVYDGDSIDTGAALELLAAHGTTGRPVVPRSLSKVSEAFASGGQGGWNRRERSAFLRLLRSAHATSALELLDYAGAWPALVPEWLSVRGRAQHDPYHRFTVDGHSFVTVAELTKLLESDRVAANIANAAGDLDALYLSALLHDVGKGSGSDHSEKGALLTTKVCERMGLDATAIADVTALVRHHLLLPDTATRRDLDDGAVIGALADTIGTARRARLLYLLAIADGRATGPHAWSEWKAVLVHELFVKVLAAIETGVVPVRSDVTHRAREVAAYEPLLGSRAQDVLETLPPSYLESTPVADMVGELKLLLGRPRLGEVRWRVDDGVTAEQAVITVCMIDRPGTLARTAGVLTLNRIPVLSARAYTTTDGFALTRFVVGRAEGTRLDRAGGDIEAAFSGRLALDAAVRAKVVTYRQAGAEAGRLLEVRVLNEDSEHSTVIEVRSPDALGLLYAITSGISDLDLDIHVAKVDTLASRVVDVFYVRTPAGTKLAEDQASAVATAIGHRVRQLFE